MTLNSGQGLVANLTTAGLVIAASRAGLPVSTTHVATGGLFGIGLITGTARLHHRQHPLGLGHDAAARGSAGCRGDAAKKRLGDRATGTKPPDARSYRRGRDLARRGATRRLQTWVASTRCSRKGARSVLVHLGLPPGLTKWRLHASRRLALCCFFQPYFFHPSARPVDRSARRARTHQARLRLTGFAHFDYVHRQTSVNQISSAGASE